MPRKEWYKSHEINAERQDIAERVLSEIRLGKDVMVAIRRNPLPSGGYLPKNILIAIYRQQVESGQIPVDPELLVRLRMKPVRTLSGVTTVTVLTRPQPCPGDCIFCPDDARMPKSYLPDEPGAARAFENNFDPYEQVRSRLYSLHAVGHPTDKIELLILGGTWDSYPPAYQVWFIGRCFEAINPPETSLFPAKEQDIPPLAELLQALKKVFKENETALQRNVGLVVETRPDQVTPQQLAWLRRLGVTKVQMGIQSLDDSILKQNCRGHGVEDARRAVMYLRDAAFKIVLHWMPNLLGATPASDRIDFARLWEGFCPDEIKIYPTQLLPNTALYTCWKEGRYRPYSTEELIDLLADLKPGVPLYCRINRIIRDIPSTYVVEGNRRTSLRQDVLGEMARRGTACHCVRCREIRSQKIDADNLRLDDLVYRSFHSEEHFLSFVTPDDQLAGYLRLSLPDENQNLEVLQAIAELRDCALIREVHVFGQALPFGGEQSGSAQHIGLGTALLQKAEAIAFQKGYPRLAVIAAVGTRRYYASRGFESGTVYMLKSVTGKDRLL